MCKRIGVVEQYRVHGKLRQVSSGCVHPRPKHEQQSNMEFEFKRPERQMLMMVHHGIPSGLPLKGTRGR